MESVASVACSTAGVRSRDLVWPKEHGSWSLALEPVALGLLAAPSWAGGALAVAVAAGFFSRRPLRIAARETRPIRRHAAARAAIVCGIIALGALGLALRMGGTGFLPWLLPSAMAGAIFLYFDLRQAGREQAAEVSGALAFAWLPAVFAALAGWPNHAAVALAVAMIARALPTVLTVRASVRWRKSGERRVATPLTAAAVAVMAVAFLVQRGDAPVTALVLVAIFGVRSFALLVFPRPTLRASTIGMIEAVAGVAFVVATALAWR